MPDELSLTPATTDDTEQAIAFGLRFSGRRRLHVGDELMARITAEHVVKYLDAAGYVVMKKPPARGHSTPGGFRPTPRLPLKP